MINNSDSAIFFCHPGFVGACAPPAHLVISDRAANLATTIDVRTIETRFEMTAESLFESELWFLDGVTAQNKKGVSKRAYHKLDKLTREDRRYDYEDLLIDRRSGLNHYSTQATDVLLVAARQHLALHFTHKFDAGEWLHVADFLVSVHQMSSTPTVLEIMLTEFQRISTVADLTDPEVLWFMAPKLGIVHDVPAARQYLRDKVFA